MSEPDIKKSAHDLNNILTGILNNIYYLEELNDLPANASKILANLENDAKRAADIIEIMLSKKKRDEIKLDKIFINEIAGDVINSLKTGLPEKISIKLNSDESIPPIIANKTDIYRIILNIIKNSIEAVEPQGEVELTTGYDSGNVYIKIADNGEGISKENIDKIFDSGFSTKDKKTESGYGLSVVKEKINAYRGSINVFSDTDKTEFKLEFPAFVKEEKKKHNILIAEDDESVLEVLSDLLESYNYIITKTADGLNLVNLVLENSFDLLLIDKKLPGKDGLQSIREIRAEGIDSPIILASGSEFDEDEESIKELKIDKIIRKPYNFPEIIDAIRKLV